MNTKARIISVGTLLSLTAVSAHAGPTEFYSETFERNFTGPEWSSNTTIDRANRLSRYAGDFNRQTISLTLNQPPLPQTRGDVAIGNQGGDLGSTGSIGDGGGGNNGGGGGGGDGTTVLYTLELDFYPIDSWDGNRHLNGPDVFQINANNNNIFSETFDNVSAGQHQTFRAPNAVGQFAGNTSWNDAIYRNIQIPFVFDSTGSVTFTFTGIGLQSPLDESWGIDNISLSYTVVPAPAPLALTSLLGVLGLRRSRRNESTL